MNREILNGIYNRIFSDSDKTLDLSFLGHFDNINELEIRIDKYVPIFNEFLLGLAQDLDISDRNKSVDRAVMILVLQLAEAISTLGEVPVAAVLLNNQSQIVAFSLNVRENNQDPLGHAECKLISKFCAENKTWRLDDYSLYVNLEPCIMCCGLIRQVRLRRLIFAALDYKQGCVLSRANLLDLDIGTKKCEYEQADKDLGLFTENQLKSFFKTLRKRNKILGSKSKRKLMIENGNKILHINNLTIYSDNKNK